MAKILHMQMATRAWWIGMMEPECFKRSDGSQPTHEEIDAFVRGVEAKGIDCFPCCDNVDEHGRCRGVEMT